MPADTGSILARVARLGWGLSLAILLPTPAAAETPPPGDGHFLGFPIDQPYAPYIADPHRAAFGVMWADYDNVGIDDTSHRRMHLNLGGAFGLVRIHPAGRPQDGWQINLVAGVMTQFDILNNWDSIGWDGVTGLTVTTALTETLGLKLGLMHTSSHLGDELIQRVGRERIGYTREEYLAGVSWSFAGRWRTYGEGGWAFTNDAEPQEPGRIQAGLEYEVLDSFRSGRMGWYAALDLQSFEEKDWQIDVAAQGGLVFPRGERRFRLGMAYYVGRVPIGEFFQDDEGHVTAGLWLDL